MSVSFMWEVVKPERARSFGAGTSSDIEALERTFPGGTISTDDIPILQAMHRAARGDKTLRSEIADTLKRLQGDDYDKKISISVWTQF